MCQNFVAQEITNLSENDIYQLKTFEDSVAVSRAPFSSGKSTVTSMAGKIVLPGSFEIPLRSLYSQKIKNLLWAGPQASFDHHVAQTVFIHQHCPNWELLLDIVQLSVSLIKDFPELLPKKVISKLSEMVSKS